jgi:hypothetical protein
MSCPRQAEACSTGEEHGDEPRHTMYSVIQEGRNRDLSRWQFREWDHESRAPFCYQWVTQRDRIITGMKYAGNRGIVG